MLAADVKNWIVGIPIVDIPDLQRTDEVEEESSNESKVTTGVHTYKGRIYLTKDNLLRTKVVTPFPDNPKSGHFGVPQTAELVSRNIYRPALEATLQKYIPGCELCHRIKPPRHTHPSTNMLLAPLSWP